ncbi:hypothetical protein SEA_SYRA333_81 [Mycobacterium phage Syra333]|uniref:Uncharacterized protein n=1 Tax=Mycobacterium phage Ximenita TaxID=2708633 RepID=A0A6G6XS57_9CAUD|nr:hypothetical protein I5G82_gp024 [Mycobacterium phage Ximenita]QIG61591.1 hypothetical protein SEA_XIMENITA_83 [Mycobacterium phage Ximenita]WNM69593.1 hypothetical protein SEA_SYRA333_81 [Mycobacterium phage Syra333]
MQNLNADNAAGVEHVAGVFGAPRGSRQPWRAECTCGWVSVSYAADHAAQIMADDHVARA